MKKAIILSIFILTTMFCNAQSDTSRPKELPPDSVYDYPDTVIIKVPKNILLQEGRLNGLQLFQAIFTNADFSHKGYLFMLDLFTMQINRQMLKRPVVK